MLKIQQKILNKPLPKRLFYPRKPNSEYLLIDLANKEAIGYMMVTPRKDELYINFLNVKKEYRGQGVGKTMLNFAKNLSQKLGLNSRLRVLSSITPQEPEIPPHIFYRKYGFTACDKDSLKAIDLAIKENRQVDSSLNHMMYMYYPE